MEASLSAELEAARLEMLRIRFRRVMGESVAPHLIKNARKSVAKCVKSLQCRGGKDA
ncbi:MAG: 50S ribosomal protein L29 [Holosporaceae bacterium]|nr:50S ribosomal protein L29 [Holosporaceae bacterium]